MSGWEAMSEEFQNAVRGMAMANNHTEGETAHTDAGAVRGYRGAAGRGGPGVEHSPPTTRPQPAPTNSGEDCHYKAHDRHATCDIIEIIEDAESYKCTEEIHWCTVCRDIHKTIPLEDF